MNQTEPETKEGPRPFLDREPEMWPVTGAVDLSRNGHATRVIKKKKFC